MSVALSLWQGKKNFFSDWLGSAIKAEYANA
jgi:hypothetical protein